jgi:hypothetical protein
LKEEITLKAAVYFSQVAEAEDELVILQARLQHYEDLGLIRSSAGSHIGSGNSPISKVEEAAVGLVDVECDLRAKIERFTRLIAQAEQIINQIPQSRYRRLLKLKYLCRWPDGDIAKDLKYNDSNSVYRAKRWALMQAQEIINKMGI